MSDLEEIKFTDKPNRGLCFRCEHRVLYYETKKMKHPWQPRCECGDEQSNKFACYMYKPVTPVILSKLDNTDPRPQFGPAVISARSRRSDEDPQDLVLNLREYETGYMVFWEPSAVAKKKAKKKPVKKVKKKK